MFFSKATYRKLESFLSLNWKNSPSNGFFSFSTMPLYGNYGPPAHVPHYEQSYGYQKQYKK